MGRTTLVRGITCLLLIALASGVATAALPREVRKELSRMSKEARSVSGLVRKQQIDDARALIRRLEEQATELDIPDDERDRTWKAFQRNLERARSLIPVSFESEVAPILTANCIRCHGAERASADLQLDTFQGLRRGGRSGALLRPGRPRNSHIMARVTAADDRQRMPRNGDRLSDADLQTLARWIDGGAEFDGDDESAPIGQSTKEPPANVKVAMADGTETVSFKDEVAPILVTFCLRCHRGNEPAGGFSVVTIEEVIRGGDTGDTILPGNSDDSYLWKLVGLQDPIKMPQGQALLKRSQARTIKRWIDEGARFDGPDVKTPLRNLVPTEAEKQSDRLAAMSDDDFEQRRIQQAADMWKRAIPRQEFQSVTSDHFHICGNVGSERLNELSEIAEAQTKRLQNKFGSGGGLWRGRLIVFVLSDRFDYTEFNTVLLDRRTPAGIHGHVTITAQLSEAWIAMYDRDSTSETELTSDQQIKALVAQAWLARDGATLPDWLQQGFGLLESGVDKRFLTRLQPQAQRAVRGLTSPTAMFRSGTFTSEDLAITGALLTQFLQTQSKAGFRTLQQALRTADSPSEAVSSAYGQPAETIAQAFVARLSK